MRGVALPRAGLVSFEGRDVYIYVSLMDAARLMRYTSDERNQLYVFCFRREKDKKRIKP